jgi:hypothetical protein
MSFLYPLFLAGIAAVAVPILLHMIRRHTRRRVAFSSLMFLRTTVPRFKNRRRLEHLPLLVVRCIVVALLAFAFARPFFPRPAVENRIQTGRRIVLLVDTSASMRRIGMWTQAVSEAQAVLHGVKPMDRVCVMTFDTNARTLVGFDQWEVMEPGRRVSTTVRLLSERSPSWAATDLGHALIAGAEAIEEDEANDEQRPIGSRRVVLISDVQKGSNLEALAAYEWPGEMNVVVRAVPCRGTTNAAPQLVANRTHRTGSDEAHLPGIRIVNSSDASTEHFQVTWAHDGSAGPPERTQVAYVPPGRSTVLGAPADVEPSSIRKVVLTGDDHDFDNTLYVAPDARRPVNILYIGDDDPNDTEGMLYYVRQAFDASGDVTSRVSYHRGNAALTHEDVETADFVIVTNVIDQANLASLRRHLESGRTVLLVMTSVEVAATLSGLTGLDRLESEEAEVDRYAMLGRMEFTHPLLIPFSDPRFGNFTRIHIWKYRRTNVTDCPGAQVLAWFDSNDPAWFEVAVGQGTLLVWTCGWHPADSDLALSSKFVPLLHSALEYGGRLVRGKSQYAVGDAVPTSVWTRSGADTLHIRKPDDSAVHLDAAQQTFTQTDLPGIYRVTSSAGTHRFAVNLSARECLTTPMPIEHLENLGISLKWPSHVAGEGIRQTTQRAGPAETESQQKLWRWVIVGTLVLLLIEIWLGGWLTGPRGVSGGQRI